MQACGWCDCHWIDHCFVILPQQQQISRFNHRFNDLLLGLFDGYSLFTERDVEVYVPFQSVSVDRALLDN